jgi:ketosteroid isomerase-like protein
MFFTQVARPARARRNILALALAALLVPDMPAPAASAAGDPDPATEVRATEVAFAATMAARDHAAFTSFLSDEAVFFGGAAVKRGKHDIATAWKRFFEGDVAPFSWAPADVEVLDSGTLALSSGPVHDPQGTQIGIFTSIWRLEPDGKWRIVFDKGCPYCEAVAR